MGIGYSVRRGADVGVLNADQPDQRLRSDVYPTLRRQMTDGRTHVAQRPRKAGPRSITKTLTPEDAERLRPYFAAHRRLRQLITELEAVSIELAEQPPAPKTPGDHAA